MTSRYDNMSHRVPQPPRVHPLFPAFKRWADQNIPAIEMRENYWQCFLAGFVEGRAVEKYFPQANPELDDLYTDIGGEGGGA